MTINELCIKASTYAEKQGFHKKINFGEKLMLVVSELSEALEASRKHAPYDPNKIGTPYSDPEKISKDEYETVIKGTVAEELADAVIRIADIADIYGINLDFHIRAKMAYNETRPYMHGKSC